MAEIEGQKIYLFEHLNEISTDTNFVHFWDNDSTDFYDYKNQTPINPEQHWKQYVVTKFNNFEHLLNHYHPDYVWKKLDIRIEKRNMDTFYIDLAANEISNKNSVFIKIVDDKCPNFPFYYYSIDITENTNQSNQISKYRVVFKLDLYATFYFNYHKWLDSYNQRYLFYQKTHDRFRYNEDKGYFLDYNDLNYLNFYDAELNGVQLIKSDEDKILSYEEMLYINSDFTQTYYDWLNTTYYNWLKKPFAGFFSAKNLTDDQLNSLITSSSSFNWSNKYISELDDMSDNNYNSNGMYRWLCLKTGDNIHSSTSGQINGSVFENKSFYLKKDIPVNITEVLNIDENEVFCDPANNSEILGQHTQGESWEINFTKSFELNDNLTSDDLRNGIVINTDNKIFNENIANFQIYSKRGNDKHTLRVASDNLNEWMRRLVMFPLTSWMTTFLIKTNGTDPYMILDHNVNDYSNGFWGYLGHLPNPIYYSFLTNFPVMGLGFDLIWTKFLNGILGKISSSFHSTTIVFDEIQDDIEYILNSKGLNYQWSDNALPDVGRWANLPGLKEVLYIKFNGNMCTFGLRISGSKLSHNESNDQLFLKFLNKLTFGKINISLKESLTSYNKKLELTGEEMCLIPVKKQDQIGVKDLSLNDTSLSKTIFYLNNSEGVTLGNNSIIGSLINDIPPLLLAIASKKNKISAPYSMSFTNIISNEMYEENNEKHYSPFDLQAISLGRSGIETSSPYREYKMPVIFTDTSYIPITIARSPILNDIKFDDTKCVGGNHFFEKFFNLMTNEELTRENTIESDPSMFSPQIFKWSYITDGIHNLTIDGAMINLNNLVNQWNINLNCFLSNNTYFKLDLGNLKNEHYKFTKTFSELTTVDTRNFSYSTSAYNNWLENNQVSLQTARNLLDRDMRYNLMSGGMNLVEGVINGAVQGGLTTGDIGGVVAGAGIGAGVGTKGILNTILSNKHALENFNTKWQGRFTNMYRSPSLWNGSGFSDGSVNYSPWSPEDNSQFNLGRTFVLPYILWVRRWWNVRFNGYPVNEELNYSEYDNRRVFNFFALDTKTNKIDLVNYLREKSAELIPLFNLESYIDSFLVTLTKGVRLWKRKFDSKKMEQYVRENIENKYVPPFSIDKSDLDIPIEYSEERNIEYNIIPTNLEIDDYTPDFLAKNNAANLIGPFQSPIEVTGNDSICQNHSSSNPSEIAVIKYEDLGVANRQEFIDNFSKVNLNLFGTNILIGNVESIILNKNSSITIDLEEIGDNLDFGANFTIITYGYDINKGELAVDENQQLTGWLYNPALA